MERVLVQLPEELLARVDEERGDVPRSAWIRRACEMRLGGRPKRVWKGTAAEWAAFEEGAGLQPAYKFNVSVPEGEFDKDPHAFADEVAEKLEELNPTAPVPCQCGGKIYQVGAKKGQCSRCSKPRPA